MEFRNIEPSDQYAEFRNYLAESATLPLMIPHLMPGEYRNPFDFLDEFDKWFEFQRRKRFDKESTLQIISEMLSNDLKRAAKSLDTNYSPIRYTCRMEFGASVIQPRSILLGMTS